MIHTFTDMQSGVKYLLIHDPSVSHCKMLEHMYAHTNGFLYNVSGSNRIVQALYQVRMILCSHSKSVMD